MGRAVVVNSGCANACTGTQGMADAEAMADQLARLVGCAPSEVLVASTGVIGVNLVHAALYHHADPATLLDALLDNLTTERVEVDMVKLTGPAFAGVDNRVIALQLVQRGLTKAAMFLANGEVVQPADVLYRKSILVERGSFRPVIKTTLDMLEIGRAHV